MPVADEQVVGNVDVFSCRYLELAPILGEIFVHQDEIKEIPTYGKCRVRSLAEGCTLEMYLTVFSAYPCATNKIWRDGDKLSISSIVGCACLSATLHYVGGNIRVHPS